MLLCYFTSKEIPDKPGNSRSVKSAETDSVFFQHKRLQGLCVHTHTQTQHFRIATSRAENYKIGLRGRDFSHVGRLPKGPQSRAFDLGCLGIHATATWERGACRERIMPQRVRVLVGSFSRDHSCSRMVSPVTRMAQNHGVYNIGL